MNSQPGVATVTWFWWAVGIAIAHQWSVWFCWRVELHPGLLSKKIGSKKLTFRLYAIDFSHLYIWVHYHCREKPDMARIYGTRGG